jgi:thioredoxin-like negative regulator of GroEL
VRVIKVDAARQPQVARAFGVLTVPSTVVLAPSGNVVAVNHGFAPTGRLVEQLQHS